EPLLAPGLLDDAPRLTGQPPPQLANLPASEVDRLPPVIASLRDPVHQVVVRRRVAALLSLQPRPAQRRHRHAPLTPSLIPGVTAPLGRRGLRRRPVEAYIPLVELLGDGSAVGQQL